MRSVLAETGRHSATSAIATNESNRNMQARSLCHARKGGHQVARDAKKFRESIGRYWLLDSRFRGNDRLIGCGLSNSTSLGFRTLQGFFVTGTDTDVGKTLVSAWLMTHLDADYWKPVQAGTAPVAESGTVRRLAGMSADRI